MSSSSSSPYNSSSGSSRNNPSDDVRLPPLRAVLGDQLALPVHGSRYSSAGTYDPHSSTSRGGGHHGSGSGSHYTSYPVSSSTGTYHDHPHGHSSYHYDADMTHPYAQMNREDLKKYVCTWEGCGKRFERQNALDTHMNIHTEAKPFPCPVCGKLFNVRSNMRRHLLTHNVDPSGEYNDISHSKAGSSSSSSYYSSSR